MLELEGHHHAIRAGDQPAWAWGPAQPRSCSDIPREGESAIGADRAHDGGFSPLCAGSVPLTGSRDSGHGCWVASARSALLPPSQPYHMSATSLADPWSASGQGLSCARPSCPPPGWHHSHAQGVGGRRGCK